MRRRVPVVPEGPPLLLRRFDPAGWPAAGDAEAFVLWRDAGRVFCDVHGWPGGPVALVLLQRRERVRVLGGPTP